MQKKSSSLLLALLATVGLASCEADIAGGEQATYLTDPNAVHVTATIAGDQTRMNALGNGDTFENGDMIYVENTSQTDSHNHAVYKYNGSTWELYGTDYMTWAEGENTFQAYYPYDPKVTTTSYTSFTVPSNQSSEPNLKAADWMTATAKSTQSDNNIALKFSHKLAKVTVTSTKFYGDFNYDYTLGAVTIQGITAYKNSTDNTYTTIIDPTKDAEVVVTMKHKTNTNTTKTSTTTISSSGASFEAGNTYSYNLEVGDGLKENPANAEIGDYYLSDGTLIDNRKTLTADQKTKCIGVVFYKGKHSNDNSTYTSPSTVHGYVIALKNANSSTKYMWSSSSADIDGVTNDSDSSPTDWSGYGNTQAILDKYSSNGYAAYYANNYGNAPSGTSGWFLPAAAQLKEALNNATVRTNIQNAGGGNVISTSSGSTYYWSSSENSKIPKTIALKVGINSNSYVSIDNGGKNAQTYLVRPVLTF